MGPLDGDKAAAASGKGLRGVPKQQESKQQGWLANVGVHGFINELVGGGQSGQGQKGEVAAWEMLDVAMEQVIDCISGVGWRADEKLNEHHTNGLTPRPSIPP